MAGIRSTKGPFLILSLLCLVYVESSLDFKDHMEMHMRNLQNAIKEVARKKAEEKDRNEITSKLLDAARSLTDENELEIFEDYLQEAVDQANRQKAEDRDRFEDVSNQVDKQIKKVYPSMQLLKMASHPLASRDLLDTAERVFKKLQTYLDLKKQGFAGKEGYTEEAQKEILKVFHFQQDDYVEL